MRCAWPPPMFGLRVGDLVTVVGPPSEISHIVTWIGDLAGERIDRDHSELDMRRIFVSNREVAGRELRDSTSRGGSERW